MTFQISFLPVYDPSARTPCRFGMGDDGNQPSGAPTSSFLR